MEKIILMFVLGIIFGFVLRILISGQSRLSGVMHIDRHDPERDLYSLEITIPLDDLPKQKVLYIEVDPDARLSQ